MIKNIFKSSLVNIDLRNTVKGDFISIMINMEYSIWRDTCKGFFDLNNSVMNKYFQLFPFTLLAKNQKERIASEDFFNIYIKGGALFADPKVFDTPNRYLQKSDSTFRVTKLVSPMLYLYLLSIGTQVSKKYKNSRKNTRVYHAGNINEYSYHYKESYDNYYADINQSQEYYKYFIKIDITSFYDLLNTNELFKKINRDGEILDLRTTFIYKNILNMIGDEKYPTVENNAGLSYLATEIYLDDSDAAIEKYLEELDLVSNFQLVRFVDDLFIFFDCEIKHYNVSITEIKNKLIDIYSKTGLSMNEKKFRHDRTENTYSVLQSALYDFYVDGSKIDFSAYYSSEDLVRFFNNLIDISENHSHKSYKDVLKETFRKENIKYSEEEVLNHFLFYRSDLFKSKDVKNKIEKLILRDYRILKYSIRHMVLAVCNTSDGTVIKNLLNQIFNNSHSNNGDIFDEAIIITYLINRRFKHEDLQKILEALNDGATKFIEDNCKISFFNKLEEKLTFNNLYDVKGKQYQLLISDKIIWFQFFMFNYYEKVGRYLESYSYLKVFFDRFIAYIMHCTGIDTCGNKNKPNINRYHKEKEIIKGLNLIKIESVNGESIKKIIEDAHNLRNESPVNHASSEILNHSHIRSTDLAQTKINLKQVIKLCLEKCSVNN